MNYAQLLEKARKTNKERDESDHSVGFAAPGDCDLAAFVRNAMCAIHSGLETAFKSKIDPDSASCIAEGLAMLEEIELRLRKSDTANYPGERESSDTYRPFSQR